MLEVSGNDDGTITLKKDDAIIVMDASMATQLVTQLVNCVITVEVEKARKKSFHKGVEWGADKHWS